MSDGDIHWYLNYQYEAKMSTLNETIKDIDSKKKQLQETVDSLNDQVEMLKMEGMYCNILNITKIDKVRGYRHQLLQT